MVKAVFMMKMKQGMSSEQFIQHYREHCQLTYSIIPGIKKYVRNIAVRFKNGEPAFDGISEIWFEDKESWKNAGRFENSEEGRVVKEDGDKFIDRANSIFILVDEEVVEPPDKLPK